MGLTILGGIFCIILLVARNIVIDLNNVMQFDIAHIFIVVGSAWKLPHPASNCGLSKLSFQVS